MSPCNTVYKERGGRANSYTKRKCLCAPRHNEKVAVVLCHCGDELADVLRAVAVGFASCSLSMSGAD